MCTPAHRCTALTSLSRSLFPTAAYRQPRLTSERATAPVCRRAAKKIAIVPGDGIGPEVMDEAIKVLDAGAETARYLCRCAPLRASFGC
jgi:hypothetical protein